MHTVGEALAEMLPAFRPREPASRPLDECLGLTLADDVTAPCDLPRFDDSAMDGYAVRRADVASVGTRLCVRGTSAAGGGLPEALQPGRAMRIFTGAVIPAGADAVVMQEHVDREGDAITIRELPGPGAHIRRRGSDVTEGSLALAHGTVLHAGELALLAALGLPRVPVHRRPRVAILCTGDELREPGFPLEPGRIVNSNAVALAAQVRACGGEPWVLSPARDDVDAVAAGLREAFAADCVLTVGGVSVGDRDPVREAFTRAGVEPRFWKVAIKPGKPLLFGVRHATGGVEVGAELPVVGLPGNPVSAMITFEVFVKPGLRRMLGAARPHPVLLDVVLAASYRHGRGRTEFARASLHREGERVVARLHARQGSGALTSMVGVDALVVLPPDRESFDAGDRVAAIELHGARCSDASPFA